MERSVITYRSRYQHDGLRYRCVIKKPDGTVRRSRWFENRIDAFFDAMYWHKFYARLSDEKKKRLLSESS